MTREDAKREILFAKREVMADSWIDKAYDVAIKALEQPEIVRCEACRNWNESDCHSTIVPNVRKCMVMNVYTDPDQFCKYGEKRREDG